MPTGLNDVLRHVPTGLNVLLRHMTTGLYDLLTHMPTGLYDLSLSVTRSFSTKLPLTLTNFWNQMKKMWLNLLPKYIQFLLLPWLFLPVPLVQDQVSVTCVSFNPAPLRKTPNKVTNSAVLVTSAKFNRGVFQGIHHSRMHRYSCLEMVTTVAGAIWRFPKSLVIIQF